MSRKESIRTNIRARRAALARSSIRRASARIQRALVRLPEWQAARQVCVYLALPTEVRTAMLIKAAWKAGKKVLAPAYRKTKQGYAWARLRPGALVKPGPWSVPEPANPEWAAPARVGLVVTPGLAFDRRGGRLGHGGGHYDRLLSAPVMQKTFKVGLALDCQVIARVPMNKRDIRMDAVVTERSVHRRRADQRSKRQMPENRRHRTAKLESDQRRWRV